MDHQQQQQQQQMSTGAVTTPTTPSPVVKPATVLNHQLGAIEEFVMGCLSGVFGAFLSWFHLSGLEFIFYVILLPSLVLEIWESYVLFHKATKTNSEAEYRAAQFKAVARKQLIRQLFGQGVIMGTAGLEITHPDFDFSSSSVTLSTATFYAVAWLAWIVVCHALNSMPNQDKIAHQVKKQQQRIRRTRSGNIKKRNSSKSSLRRSRSCSSNACFTPTSSHSSTSSSQRTSERRTSRSHRRSAETCVPVDLA